MRYFLALAAGLAGFLSGPASAAYDLRISTASDRWLVAPSGSSTLTLRFENAGDAPSPAGYAYDFFVDRYSLEPEYGFALQLPGACSALVPLPGTQDSGSFEIGALLPGQSVECTVQASRLPASTSDVRLVVKQDEFDLTPGNSVTVYAGAPVEGALRIEKGPVTVVDGQAQQTVRILFDHAGPVGLQRLNFGYCLAGEATTIEVEFPDACLASGIPYGICFIGSDSYEFDGPVAVGETASCLLRISQPWPPGANSYGARLSLDTLAENTDGGWTAILDRGAAVDLGITLAGAASAPRQIPAWSVDAACLAALGMIALALARR